ncbi:PREDICTED: uncharacterized protein LOC107100693 [Cyprinodon variegatus]|uniref:uncharacterized protein LOC107100693 n=1 Tax=Cyprinodon variegatus TaxID=28743 RepID=UPI000742BA35|nr:PREDICTED: uncharacterized protein LOC107100693 [Cyprinodon variegatus]
MTKIFGMLDDLQYKKMVEFYEKNQGPSQKRLTAKFKKELPEKHIQMLGIDKSISLVNEAMKEIPRNDPDVQDLLRPFVEQLGLKQENQAAGEFPLIGAEERPIYQLHTCSNGCLWVGFILTDRDTAVLRGTLMKAACFYLKINETSQHIFIHLTGAETRSHHEQTGLAGAIKPEQKQDGGSGVTQSPQRIRPNMSISIKDLKASGDLGQKILVVKVVQKSGLAKFTKKKQEGFYFHVAVADDTGAIKAVVFGKEKYPTIQEGSFYTLREVLMDQKENILKVTEKAKISRTSPFDIPKNMELEAEKLLSPLFTIREVKRFEDKKEVSVKGTVKEIGEPTKIKKLKRDKLDFELEDETGSITIGLWSEKRRQLDGISIGDVVKVQYLKTNRYIETVSLNSTDLTRINKIESAEVQKVTINIIGISKVDKIMTELDVEISNQMKMLEVSSPLLAEVFGLCLDDNFQSKLLEKIPHELEAEIQGNKIKNLKAKA